MKEKKGEKVNIFKKLRDDNSIVCVKIKEPRVNAIFSSHLRKYVVSIAGAIYKGKLKKMLGFSNIAVFNIIVDVEEEVYKNVFIKEIIHIFTLYQNMNIYGHGHFFLL